MAQPSAIAASASPMLALPAELREYIYSLVYPPNASERGDFLDLRPPDKSLLLTCRQVYSEARNIHRAEYRHYWTDTDFVLDVRIPHRREEEWMNAVNKYGEDIEHIRSLRVEFPTFEGVIVLIDNRGGWKVQKRDFERHFRVRQWLYRGEVDPTRLAWDGAKDEASLRQSCAGYPCGLPWSQQIPLLPTLSDFLFRN